MKKISKRDISFLRTIVGMNKHIDFKKINLNGELNLAGFRFDGISIPKSAIIELLKAYQRLLRICEEYGDEVIWALMSNGFCSAVEIANMSKNTFLEQFKKNEILPAKIVEDIHKRARQKRSQILPQFMNMLQNNEPHIKSSSI